MSISVVEDIKTFEDLERNPGAVIEQVQRTGRPTIIAEGGKPAVVVLTAQKYERLVHLVNLARMLNEAEADVRAGRVRPLEEVVKEFEDEGKLPRRRRRAGRS